MKISVFTPLYHAGNPYIAETWRSLQAQTHQDWEWIVLINNGGKLPPGAELDARVKVTDLGNVVGTGIGWLKSECCKAATGEALLELDHDDLLRPDALQLVNEAFAAGADFVYSDFAEFHTDTWRPNPYSSAYGWECYGVEFEGHPLVAMRAPSDPLAWRRIEWAPNHLRAWRASTYRWLGGHSPTLHFADDHDLVLRTYLSGSTCHHLPHCLYFYRVHPNQNVRLNNDKIQSLEAGVYDRYIYPLAEKVALNCGLRLIDLCGAHGCPPWYTPIDREPLNRAAAADWDKEQIFCDLNGPWNLRDDSVGVLRAFDAIEHLKDPVHTMNEAWRVLAPGGVMLVLVPSTDAMVLDKGDGKSELINGSGAYCDPTHVSFWNRLSFRYYTNDQFRKYVPGIKARFQIARCHTVNLGGIPYVQAELIALKPGYSPMGAIDGP